MPDRRSLRDGLIIVAVFLAFRVVGWAVGVQFDASHLGSNWQFMDVELLRAAPFRTVWFMHAQPPLFNLLIAGGLQVGDGFGVLMAWVFGAVSLGGILGLYGLSRAVLGSRVVALGLALWFCVSPDVLLFSELLNYDSLVPWFLCMGMFGLWAGLAWDRVGWLMAGFAMLAGAVLVRSMMHPAWLALVAGLVFVLSGFRWRVLAGAAPALGVVGALLAKNLVLFGFLGLSSWGPLNLVGVTVERLPPELREAMIADGRLSKLSGLYSFPYIEELLPLLPPIAKTGEPVLDNLNKANGLPNYNHMAMLVASKLRMPDAVAALKADPLNYARVLAISFYHFERPSNEFRDALVNRALIYPWARWVNAVVGLQPAAWTEAVYDREAPGPAWRRVSVGSVLVLLGFLVAVGVGGIRVARVVCARGQAPAEMTALAVVLFTGLFVVCVSSALDVTENHRARFTVAPLLTLGAVWLVTNSRRRAEAGESLSGSVDPL